jgi:hypothetical protein
MRGINVAKIYDEFCAWPYILPYGWVMAPKVKKPRKPRTPRAPKPDWLKAAKPKKEKPDGTPRKPRKPRRRKQLVEAPAPVRQAPVLEAAPQGFQEIFNFWANRPPIDFSEYRTYNPAEEE